MSTTETTSESVDTIMTESVDRHQRYKDIENDVGGTLNEIETTLSKIEKSFDAASEDDEPVDEDISGYVQLGDEVDADTTSATKSDDAYDVYAEIAKNSDKGSAEERKASYQNIINALRNL
uniref:HYPK_UBA domain-containing protein n=1 Tax=Panagrellus redivivus TaxID=6233 RepID=A0A7E4VN52_PANRE